jgi:signal transduction histidine kinase
MSFWTPVENPGTRPPRSWAFDIGCALVAAAASFGTFSFAQTAHPAHPPLAVSLLVALVTVLVLPLRRVWPGPVFGVVVLMAAVLAQWPVSGELFPVALAIALYTVATRMSRAAALAAAALAVAAEVPAAGQGGWHNGWLAVVYVATGVAAVLIAGLYASTRRAYLAELRDRAQRLEREHDQTSALAAAVERARIAREMHDSVAHHLTVIVALSDGALATVTRAPAQATEAMRGVSSTAREALAETRRLLGVLRADGGPELRQPLPGLTDLEGLFTRVRAAGLPVRYERSGPLGDTPPGIQLVVFRLVQEALTNTMKHAGPGASAAVRLRLAPGDVEVEVEDDGAGSAGVPRAPGGGMTGMAERVSAFGGELNCGPRQPRGWRVTARLAPGLAAPP